MNKKNKKNNSSQLSSSYLENNRNFFIAAVMVLLMITTGVYLKSLNNQLTNWDDDRYITNNADITTLHGDSVSYTVKKAFTSYVMGNYHPLTMLSYCIEYHYFKLSPKPYHITNLVMHLLNTLLVLTFIWLLSKQKWVAFTVALLFAIHPMHVESVAWISERKDVLYSFFYLAALCTYLLYLKKDSFVKLFYAITLLLSVLSLLSKGMAVSFPICLFAIDYFLDRKVTIKTITEKLPFVFLSLVFGYVAIHAQQSFNTINLSNYGYFERILFSSYGLLLYLWKFVFPFNLSCLYGYPTKKEGLYPIMVYVAPIIVTAILILLYKTKKSGKDILFGVGFFLTTIFLVLQLLPVGNAIIADRYSYLPYIGLFFIVGRYLNKLWESKSKEVIIYKQISVAAVVIISFIFCYATAKRSLLWHDSFVLWNNAIDDAKEADEAFIAYYCRGQAYHRLSQYEKAIHDFDKALTLKKDYADAYYDRGYANDALGNYEQAIKDYTSAIKLKQDYADAYCNRGNAYYKLQKIKQALEDYNSALKFNPDLRGVYSNRSICNYLLKKYDDALKDAIKARELGFNENQQLYDFLLKMNQEKIIVTKK